MSNYYIKAIILQGCSYSNKAEKMLKDNNIKSDFNYINYIDKNKYKLNLINTFPQIYLNRNNKNGNLLLGGYTDLNNFIETFKNKKYNKEDINNFMYNSKWSKKATLRLIELINNKINRIN